MRTFVFNVAGSRRRFEVVEYYWLLRLLPRSFAEPVMIQLVRRPGSVRSHAHSVTSPVQFLGLKRLETINTLMAQSKTPCRGFNQGAYGVMDNGTNSVERINPSKFIELGDRAISSQEWKEIASPFCMHATQGFVRPSMLKQIYTSKPQSLLIGYPPKYFNSTIAPKTWSLLNGMNCTNTQESICSNGVGNIEILRRTFSGGFRSKYVVWNDQLIITRGLYSSSSQRAGEGRGKTLPWLAKAEAKEFKRKESVVTKKPSKSPWEVSAEKFLKGGSPVVEDEEIHRSRSRQTSYGDRDGGSEEGGEEEEEEEEAFEDPRWDKIRNRFNRAVEGRPVSDRPEVRRWNKQENWGKKTWKEATESTVPKLVGEGIYGVGPVLAALCAGRREFYALYVQEGLDLSGNNRKKKDKKGVERILRMAEKIGLSKKEVSKHDLNMVADNRPHQGFVLDASPLEMVGIRELEPVSLDEEGSPLWVALDEVTDPQNLGAIIRSAYFFGASGLVLCAKNSAPLSGVVSKASAGSLELVELRSCKNMMQFLTSSAGNGWRVIGGSVSSKAVPLNEIVPGAPSILVLGSEGMGLRPLVERSCTKLVKIPGNAPPSIITAGEDEEAESAEADNGSQAQGFRSFMAVESLNVSVAAGVLLHHFIGLNYRKNDHLQETK